MKLTDKEEMTITKTEKGYEAKSVKINDNGTKSTITDELLDEDVVKGNMSQTRAINDFNNKIKECTNLITLTTEPKIITDLCKQFTIYALDQLKIPALSVILQELERLNKEIEKNKDNKGFVEQLSKRIEDFKNFENFHKEPKNVHELFTYWNNYVKMKFHLNNEALKEEKKVLQVKKTLHENIYKLSLPLVKECKESWKLRDPKTYYEQFPEEKDGTHK